MDMIHMLSISTCAIWDRCDPEDGLAMIADAGFNGYDLDLFSKKPAMWLSGGRDLSAIRRAGEAQGLACAQTHAPFPVYFPDDEERTKEIRSRFARAMEATSALESPYMVVHPINVVRRHPRYGDSAWLKGMNLDFYGAALDRAHDLGVVIALENLFTFDADGSIVNSYVSWPEELTDLVDSLKGTVACLDTGHCLLTGRRPEDAARILGGRLGALHIQSNDAQRDLHMPPYMHPQTDWDALADALRAIGYDGWINLETFGFAAHAPAELIPAALAYQRACGALFEARVREGKAGD